MQSSFRLSVTYICILATFNLFFLPFFSIPLHRLLMLCIMYSFLAIFVRTRNILVSIIVLLVYLCFHCVFPFTSNFIHNFWDFFFGGFCLVLSNASMHVHVVVYFFTVCDFPRTAFFQRKNIGTVGRLKQWRISYVFVVALANKRTENRFKVNQPSGERGFVFIFFAFVSRLA